MKTLDNVHGEKAPPKTGYNVERNSKCAKRGHAKPLVRHRGSKERRRKSAHIEDAAGARGVVEGCGDLLSSVTGGRPESATLASGDALLGKLEFVMVGDFVDGEKIAPGCEVCCASLARRLVYALRLSFLRAGPGVTALITAGEKGEGGGTPTGDWVAMEIAGPEADSGVAALSAVGAASAGSGFTVTSNRGGSGFGAVGLRSIVICTSDAGVGHGGGGGCMGGCEVVDVASSPGASGISSVLGVGGLGRAASSASGISTSATGASSGSPVGVAFFSLDSSASGSVEVSMATVSSDGAGGVFGDGLLEATSTRAGDFTSTLTDADRIRSRCNLSS